MHVYRIGKSQYANDLNGTGAKLHGGRWNHTDIPCIYASASRALAVLEYSVNVNIDFIPRALSISVFEIDEKQVKDLLIKDLPGDWRDVPAPASTKDMGTSWLSDGTPIIRVPSIVVPEEFNYILNPLAGKGFFRLLRADDFVYDVRIKLK